MGVIDRLGNLLGLRATAVPAEPSPPQAAVIPIDRRVRKRVDARRGTSVLIIDDSKTMVVALSRMLQTGGFLIAEAYDGETGVAVARSRRPDLIFMDIVMPGMNGFAALRALRRDPALQDVPVIMMSGNEHATEQFFGSRIPADDFMKKPFSRLEVFARIESLLDERLVPQRRQVVSTAATRLPQQGVS
jgi:DNA-binding response OmpR family regulator